MILIKSVEINSFRSILNLEFDVDNTLNLLAICGENNVGKTNTLRAINLFFSPQNYDTSVDRPTLKQAQGGTRIDPKITIEFYDNTSNEFYSITRDFKYYGVDQTREVIGLKFNKNGTRVSTSSKKQLTCSEINDFLNNIEFRYIESINIDIPNLIDKLTDNAIDVEYEQSRMTAKKKALREAYNEYTSGLQEILDAFSRNISDVFNGFRENWNVKFKVPVSADTFRDLISDDVELLIDDKGCQSIEQKGSGLQRLAVILLNFEILKRIKGKKNFIVCIDEPDIYLHEGLQRKLMNFFEENSNNIQIFYTTHSKIFIDQYSMKNIILLGAKYYPQFSVRKKKNINVIETIVIDTNTDDGYEKICEHLGIEKNTYDVLKRNNILVEGGCDKKYLEELGKYFGLNIPNFISMDGVTNSERYLDFYESYYKNNSTTFKPKVKILFDNDPAGREFYKKVKQKSYQFVDVECVLLQNFNGSSGFEKSNNTCNHEIEDFVYPEVICYLVNKLLDKKSFNKINSSKISDKILKPAYKNSGILSLVEYEKNELNQEEGDKLSFVSSKKATNDIKNGLAGMFNIAGDRQLIRLIESCSIKYPFVKGYINDLFQFK